MGNWEITNNYVEGLKDKYLIEEPDYVYPCVVGSMQANLCNILSTLSVYHPEAYNRIVQELI